MLLNRERWTSLWTAASPRPATQDLYLDLESRYAEPHRHYHNAAHIDSCLALFDEVRTLVDDPVSLELALWFHDAVYDPRASDNEERSADLAAAAMRACGAETARIDHVGTLILATKTHAARREPDAPWMLDIDLAVLGAAPDTFAAYDAGIRAEYAWVEPSTYRTKRAELLAAFLARPRIYQTAFFHERFERSARTNLERTIRRLGS